MAGIGHNRGPDPAGTSWRSHCWRQARRSLLPVLPVEVVRLRVRRAQALGLDYRTYAGLRATTGRDLIAFLFSSNALGVFRDGAPLAPGREAMLARLAADRHLGAGPGLDPQALGRRIAAVSARPLPVFGTGWAAMRDEMKAWLRMQNLPGDAVLMVGETDHEAEMMAAGGLAGFISGQQYFGGMRHAV
ncbi:hypothetical protein [Paracoccus siganidrum]|uniref:Uncharacterized protein n=1 Tax=Paracoccus siganidrum TaxID=1276757 RepID=A0A418ZTE7_9RHOB|nr:hypothetical protein [Paracoccus siganidrum]RJL01492.1 hypothetical protein D3P05_22260 [Paracoccus siganidrum]RMC38300.1 hypothetical protein C9E82_07580 [Paracoccus siganidrum]